MSSKKMKRATKPSVIKSYEEEEVDKVAVQELIRRFQQCRRAKKGLSLPPDLAITLFKQNKRISVLNKEKETLANDLKTVRCNKNRKKDENSYVRISSLLTEINHLDSTIKEDRITMKEVEDRIIKVRKEVNTLAKLVLTDTRSVQIISQNEKNIEDDEKKLAAMTIRYNKVRTENLKRKEDIENTLIHRKIFNTAYRHFLDRLNLGKKIMLDMIESVTYVYNRREEIQRKYVGLRDREERDFVSKAEAMRNQFRKVTHETKLGDFVGTKGQRRFLKELFDKRNEKRALKAEKVEEMIESKKTLLETISKFSGEEDFETLANNFVRDEEINFALYNYIYTLNTDRVAIERDIEKYRQILTNRENENAEKSRIETERLHKLREEYIRLKRLAEKAEKELVEVEAKFQPVLDEVQAIFDLTRCDVQNILDPSGKPRPLKMNSLPIYLSVIDNQIRTIINTERFIQEIEFDVGSSEEDVDLKKVTEAPEKQVVLIEDKRSKVPSIPPERLCKSQPCPLCLEQDEFLELEESDLFPLSRTEVVSKINERLSNEDPNNVMRYLLHNVSACRLPKSRKIVQKRFE